MAVIYQQTFAGTNGDNPVGMTPQVGVSALVSSFSYASSDTGRLVRGSGSSGFELVTQESGGLSGADYAVRGIVRELGTDASKTFRLLARATDGNNCYRVAQSAGGSLQLRRIIAGATNAMGSTDYTFTPASATDYTIELVCNGTSISVKVDGAVVIGPVTDSTYTTGAKAGVGIGGTTGSSNTTTGFAIDTFEVDTVSAGGSTIAAISSGYHTRNINR
jgi:hypothetical protein